MAAVTSAVSPEAVVTAGGMVDGVAATAGADMVGGYGGWGWGLGYGLFFGALPLYYSTYWWDGVPYYYVNDTYYTWNGAVGQYETVNPPPEVANQVGSSAAPSSFKLFAYPQEWADG